MINDKRVVYCLKLWVKELQSLKTKTLDEEEINEIKFDWRGSSK